MAPPPFLPNVFRVVFNWTSGGNIAANVLHFHNTSGETALFNLLNVNVKSEMLVQTAKPARITTVSITHLDNLSATQEFPTVGTHWEPVTPAEDFNPATCALVSTQTGFRGLASNGRIYLPWCTDAVAQAGILTVGLEGALQTAWNTFKSAMDTAGSPLQVTSNGVYRQLTPPPNATWEQIKAPVSRPVTTLNVRSAVATQRPRQNRVQGGISTFLALRAMEEARAQPKK